MMDANVKPPNYLLDSQDILQRRTNPFKRPLYFRSPERSGAAQVEVGQAFGMTHASG